MPRRIEVELTSARTDGTWTWRAAGAREPRGVVAAELLPGAAKVGDVLRVEADFDVDGITIVSVLPAKGERREPERLELLAGGADFEPVTSTLVGKGERRDRPPRRDRPEGDRPPGGRGERGERGDRRPRPGSDRAGRSAGAPAVNGEARPDGPRPDRSRPDRPPRAERGSRPERSDRPARPDRPPRPERAAPPAKPKPTRLRPGRAHRNAVVRDLPAEQQPIAEQVLRGGLPGVRVALEEQNDTLRAEGKPEIKPEGMLSIAEQLLPRLRVAEWLDRAEAARAAIDELELGDLRSVVVAADDAAVAREESTRELATELKAALVRRQDESHHEWLGEMTEALDSGRSVRALRLSSRPPKAGAVFPPELRTRLATAAGASLTPEAGADRWVAVLEALAYSPVHGQVTVAAPPTAVSDDLRAVVTRLAGLLPDIARAFGIEPPPPGSRAPRPRRPDTRRNRPGPPEARRPSPRPDAGARPAGPTEAPVVAGDTATTAATTTATADTAAANTVAAETASAAADTAPAATDTATDATADADATRIAPGATGDADPAGEAALAADATAGPAAGADGETADGTPVPAGATSNVAADHAPEATEALAADVTAGAAAGATETAATAVSADAPPAADADADGQPAVATDAARDPAPELDGAAPELDLPTADAARDPSPEISIDTVEGPSES